MTPELHAVVAPLTDLCGRPGGPRERQLLHGEGFLVERTRNGWALGETAKDGYPGHVALADLGPPILPTHRIAAPATHVYPAPDMKSGGGHALPFAALVEAIPEETKGNGFVALTNGSFIPARHLAPVEHLYVDPVTVAEMFLGTPYLWGGNSIWGIDCSGLVQAALLLCGMECPADSHLQEKAVGREIGDDEPTERGDLLFWKGHVAIAADDSTLIHANAHHMAVVREPIESAIIRIADQGDGFPTSRRRPGRPDGGC